MRGSFDICVKNARLQYKMTLNRNITVLRGDSATGKTTLIEMIASYQANGESSGVKIDSKKACVVLTSFNWKINLKTITDSFVFIDEGEKFITSQEFAEAIKLSDNYYVIATRHKLSNLPYSTKEIYGIKNTSGNRYQGTKRLYCEFYPLYKNNIDVIENPSLVIVEDSNSGYEFYKNYFNKYNIKCISAGGKSNVYEKILTSDSQNILVIADGAAFGSEIDSVLKLKNNNLKNLIIYLPESFEWMILCSGLFIDNNTNDILNNPSEHIDSTEYFSWEQFFTKFLIDISKDTYLSYSKKKLNSHYLQNNETNKIIEVMPKVLLE